MGRGLKVKDLVADMKNVIAAVIVAVGLAVAAWIHSEGARYELRGLSSGGARVLFDRKTGAVFIPQGGEGLRKPFLSLKGVHDGESN